MSHAPALSPKAAAADPPPLLPPSIAPARQPSLPPFADPRARLVLEIVGYAVGVSPEELAGRRNATPLAPPRRLVLYLFATVFGVNATDTGRTFGRDRTTVQHSLRLIEAERDTPAVDAWVQALETALHAIPDPGVRT